MTFLEIALDCIARGWHVFPCRPKMKEPAIKGGFHAASNDEAWIRAWWERWPDANVGIATGASGLTVLDIDTGIENADELSLFTATCGPPVYLRGADGAAARLRHPVVLRGWRPEEHTVAVWKGRWRH